MTDSFFMVTKQNKADHFIFIALLSLSSNEHLIIMNRLYFFVFFIALLAFSCEPSIPENLTLAYQDLPEKIDFNLHIRPILSDRCWSCHGQDKASRKAGLRLDQEETAFAPLTEGEGFALVKGSLRKSEVFHRIISEDPDYQMPTPESHLTLNDREKAMITKWIKQGADWKEHWAFIPPKKPIIPSVQRENWTQQNPIDQFIQTKLITQGLSPSHKADKERLLRRVYMDLTGLPPSIAAIDAFLNDKSPDAFEKVVDELLQSDAYAERMTMEWMDLARYADSHGMHADGARLMWPWRDWVIESFQQNMPYDQFVTEQLAGDLLPNATKKQKLATAFNRNHAMTAEGGAVDEEFRLEYVFDRSNTTATAFLGLTMECARCHDHKFDPFSQDEFYQFAAFFNNVKELGMTGDDGNYGPMLTLPDAETETKLNKINASIQAKEKELQLTQKQLAEQGTFIKKLISNSPKRPKGLVGYFPFDRMKDYINKGKRKAKYFDGNKKCTSVGQPELVGGKKGKAVTFPGGYDEVYLSDMGLFEMTEPFSVGAWIYTAEDDSEKTQVIVGNAGEKNNFWRGWDFYLDTLNRVSTRLIHSLPHNYLHQRSLTSIPLNDWTHVAFTYDGSGKAAGVQIFINGLLTECETAFDNLYKNIHPIKVGNHELNNTPLRVGKSYRNYTGESGFFKGKLDELMIFDRQITPLEIQWIADISDVDQINLLEAYKVDQQPLIKKIKRELQQMRTERLTLMDPVMEVMIMEETPRKRPMHVLNRGVYDQPKHTVEMATPTKVLAFSEEFPANRLGLAQWLFNEKNPLTARVAVNRYWQLIFGRGLVSTPQDFGSQGALPSHPELLDYLAVVFRESGWNLKALLKEMVLSHTYQQASTSTLELMEKDPLNIWLSRSSSYRLSAEMIRDNALKASGLLVEKVGGESVKPYQPEGLWIDLGNFSHQLLHYKEDDGDKLYKRSLYTFIRRTSPPPFMTTFDVSSRDKCVVQREQTNTPLQALILLNDPQFVEAARVLAVRMQKEGGENISNQIIFAFRNATGRKPQQEEITILSELFEKERSRFQQNPKAAREVLAIGKFPLDKTVNRVTTAALTTVANTILNHDEAYMRR